MGGAILQPRQLLWARVNRMVGGAHYVHKLEFFVKYVRVFLQYNFVLRVIRVELISSPLTYRYYSNKNIDGCSSFLELTVVMTVTLTWMLL